MRLPSQILSSILLLFISLFISPSFPSSFGCCHPPLPSPLRPPGHPAPIRHPSTISQVFISFWCCHQPFFLFTFFGLPWSEARSKCSLWPAITFLTSRDCLVVVVSVLPLNASPLSYSARRVNLCYFHPITNTSSSFRRPHFVIIHYHVVVHTVSSVIPCCRYTLSSPYVLAPLPFHHSCQLNTLHKLLSPHTHVAHSICCHPPTMSITPT